MFDLNELQRWDAGLASLKSSDEQTLELGRAALRVSKAAREHAEKVCPFHFGQSDEATA